MNPTPPRRKFYHLRRYESPEQRRARLALLTTFLIVLGMSVAMFAVYLWGGVDYKPMKMY